MFCRSLTLFAVFAFCFSTAAAQHGIATHTDRSSFSAAARDLKIHDFEGIVPNSGFKHFQREGALDLAGIEFRPSGGGRFGAGAVIVVGGWYQAGPAFETTTGAKIHWSVPNQTGNAYLDVTLPRGINAVGTDVWTVGPAQSTIEITATTSDGETLTERITTPARPTPGFIGFISDSPIVSIRFTPPRGQTGLIVDNFTIGKSTEAVASNERGRTQNTRPEPQPPDIPAIMPGDRPAGRNAALQNSGTIAYVRESREIRLIGPDGSNDRQLWTHPDLNEQLGIFELAWKPDGSELAFSSPHEGTVSPYVADIYSIRPDGSALRRLTHPPARAGLAGFRKGSVTVNVSNFQSAVEGSPSFIIYVEGADDPQRVLILPGTSKTVTFHSVADFGARPQMVVAMFGKYRWFVPGVDVIAGRNVRAPMFPITGKGYELHGAFRPVWRADGSRISFRNSLCLISTTSASPAPGTSAFNPLFAGKNPMGTCTWDWGSTPQTANQIIYSENSAGSNIYQMTEGGAHPGTKLTAFSDLDYQILTDLQWLPDGNGLLYSTVNLYRDSSNIFRFDLASKRTTQVTRLQKEFAREFSVSPDGTWLVFERCPTREDYAGCDLWTVGTDGSGPRLLVRNGQRPAWGR